MKKNDLFEQRVSADGRLRYVHAVTDRAMPDESFESHTHDTELEIYRFREGKLSFFFEGRRLRISDGTMLAIVDGRMHRPILTAACRYERERILLSREAILSAGGEEFYRALARRGLLRLTPEGARAIGADARFAAIAAAIATPDGDASFRALSHTLALFSAMYEESIGEDDPEITYPEGTVGEILRYADAHLSEDLSYGAVSSRFYLSEKALYKLLRREVGFTLSEYVRARRILSAKEQLRLGRAATEVALSLGYCDYTVFYRAFLAETGRSPSQYAAENRL